MILYPNRINFVFLPKSENLVIYYKFLIKNLVPFSSFLVLHYIFGCGIFYNIFFIIISICMLLFTLAMYDECNKKYLIIATFFFFFSGLLRTHLFVADYKKAEFCIKQKSPLYLELYVQDSQEMAFSPHICCFTLKIINIATYTNQQEEDARSYCLYYYGLKKQLKVGSSLILYCPKLVPFKQFSTQCCKKNIIGILKKLPDRPFIISSSSLRWNSWHLSRRDYFFTTLIRTLNKTAQVWVKNIFFGYTGRSREDLELKDTMKLWGLSHYLARSGLHLVIIAMIWFFLISYVPIALLVKRIIILLFLILYYLLSWSSISFIRAWISLLLVNTCFILNRKIVPLSIVAVAALICTLLNPMHVGCLDFQLSFLLTAALALFNLFQTHRLFKNS